MEIYDDVFLLLGLEGANVGIIRGDGEVALVDAGWTEETVEMVLSYLSLVADLDDLRYVLVTHSDRDHIGGLRRLRDEFGVKIVVNEGDLQSVSNPSPPMRPVRPDVVFKEESELVVGDVVLDLIPTPGHTPGSTCIYYEERRLLFSGDVVMPPFFHARYNREIRVPIVRGSFETYLESLNRLADLEVDWLLPGHGMPVRDGGRIIEEYIEVTSTILGKAFNLLKDELTPSELAERLHAFPVMGPRIIEELRLQGKITKRGMKTIVEEARYQAK